MEDDQQPIDYLAGWRNTEPFVIAGILSHGATFLRAAFTMPVGVN
jgi:hypothetical protein